MREPNSPDSRQAWPLPEQPGRWGGRAAFDRQRPESGQWVFWEDRVDHVLAGRYHSVLPLHVELSPTYLCNFSCPWCSTRSAREEWTGEDVFRHPRASPLTVMRKPRLDAVIDHLAEHHVEVMWVGGEPTMNPLLYPAAVRAGEVGINQCLFTNGSLFNREQALTLFNAGLVFIRVSLNAVTPDVHQRHHDYDPRRPHAQRVLDNLAMLAGLRAERRSRTQLGVSVVVDRGNVDDLGTTMRYLADLCETQDRVVDYVMVRPAFPITGAHVDVDQAVVDTFLREAAEKSESRQRLRAAGVDVVIPPASAGAQEPMPEDDLGCLAAGWFGEITPSGDMLPCSDLYGDPEFFIGNAAAEPLETLWTGKTRRATLERVRQQRCPSRRCPANGRGYYLNRVFRQVERLRGEGKLDDVRRWAEDLRMVLPRPEHSFFL